MTDPVANQAFERSQNRAPRVVIVGAGFGGLSVARGLKNTQLQVVVSQGWWRIGKLA